MSFIILNFLLLQDASPFAILNHFYVVLGGVVLAILAVVVLFSKRFQFLNKTESELATSNINLVKTRDIQLEDASKVLEGVKLELKSLGSEYKAVVSIDIQELLDFWAEKNFIEAENKRLKAEIKVYKIALKEE